MNQVLEHTFERLDRAALARQVERLVTRLHPTVTLERRRDDRVAMPVLLRLVPLDEDHQPIDDQAITVIGKNISRRGVSFYHNRPLAYRRALISVEHPTLDEFSAEIDVTWCRFTKPGWYESGGRLMAAMTAQPPALRGATKSAVRLPPAARPGEESNGSMA